MRQRIYNQNVTLQGDEGDSALIALRETAKRYPDVGIV